MNIDLESLSVLQLKALGYDFVIQRNDALRRADELASALRMIDQQIAAKADAEAHPKSPLPGQES